ncbi:E3 ubiquitin-protein ligase SlrP [Candida viswanathii]|uniref:E3 ubiquitin-protein ligase SlrP n=1 Tax=Candida viswanathii TaxID=5486 RepID=A0A367XV67_9ASCO|nr:E3 ubiquitin-protein ligase SlrP [Candida viswanathii]
MGRLDAAYPQLERLAIRIGRDERLLDLPPTLNYLTIPDFALVFGDSDLEEDVNFRTRLAFPSDLRGLHITGHGVSGKRLMLDFETNDFAKLRMLHIDNIDTWQVFGAFPQSLTCLVLDSTPVIDFEQLENLKVLHKLVLKRLPGMDQDIYKFPASLTLLTIRGCGLKKGIFDAPKLKTMHLEHNNLHEANVDNFRVPDSVEELRVTNCNISEITFELPRRLEALNMSHNGLRTFRDLPETLQYLLSDENSFKKDVEPSVFPLGLKYLSIPNSSINENWIRKLNLCKCSELQHLDLLGNAITRIDLRYLPRSLVVLDLSDNQLRTLPKNARRLAKLEVLKLSFNSIVSNSICEQKARGPLFGDSLKRIHLWYNRPRLSSSATIALENELLSKPFVEELDVELPALWRRY